MRGIAGSGMYFQLRNLKRACFPSRLSRMGIKVEVRKIAARYVETDTVSRGKTVGDRKAFDHDPVDTTGFNWGRKNKAVTKAQTQDTVTQVHGKAIRPRLAGRIDVYQLEHYVGISCR